jgi:hypothetical protein
MQIILEYPKNSPHSSLVLNKVFFLPTVFLAPLLTTGFSFTGSVDPSVLFWLSLSEGLSIVELLSGLSFINVLVLLQDRPSGHPPENFSKGSNPCD